MKNEITKQKEFIKNARIKLGWNLSRIAETLGYNLSTFKNYSCGSRPLPKIAFSQINNILQGKYLDNCGIEC